MEIILIYAHLILVIPHLISERASKWKLKAITNSILVDHCRLLLRQHKNENMKTRRDEFSQAFFFASENFTKSAI